MSHAYAPRTGQLTTSTARPVAVIDIGATSIRMAIAEITPDRTVRPLESLIQAVSLGKDTFSQRRIRRGSIEECVRVLKSYRLAMQQYGVTSPDQMRVVATSAVREAANRLAFIDRIFIATGLIVEPLDEAEVNRITYMGVQPLLRDHPELKDTKNLVVEIGSGSTEILMVRSGNVLFSHSYRLGSLRLIEQIERIRSVGQRQRHILENQIGRFVEAIYDHAHGADDELRLVGIGGDVRFAISNLASDDTDESDEGLTGLAVTDLRELTDELLRRTDEETVERYRISFPDAETVGPALLAYVKLAERFGCERIYAAPANLRDGLLSDLANGDQYTTEFRNQIVRSAINLGRKFDFDERHARHVANLSRKLFSELADEHQLEPRLELILYLSALLYGIGYFVGVHNNHKHAMYLIRNSELFGLSRRDVLLVALIARYHRRASPQPDHEGYATLERQDRVAVLKLAAILRIAIALDETHSQRIVHIRCRKESDRMIITTGDVEDLSLEQLMLRQTGHLFEEVFGMSLLLRASRRG